MWIIKIILALTLIFTSFAIPKKSQATQYFFYDAENENEGDLIPHDQVSGIEFCQWGCSSYNYERGFVAKENVTPQGIKYFRWHITANQTDAGTEVKNKGIFPVDVPLGSTFFLAYYMRFDRINGNDIWHLDSMSGDKGIEIEGNGIRWTLSTGHWGGMPGNTTGHWTVWIGNPSPSDGGLGHLNNGSPTWEPAIESSSSDAIYLNQSEYSKTNPIQLDYEKWYSVVMKLTFNSTVYAEGNTPDGAIEAWINGIKIASYSGIWLASQSYDNNITQIHMNGTIAQNLYDCPEHYRSYDALLFTDSWQDIVDRDYLTDPERVTDTTPPAAPINLSAQ